MTDADGSTNNQPVSLLYVDDEEDLLRLGKLFLERSGEFVVDILPSALDALNSPRTQFYDAIISDYQMPGMDGIAFLKAIRKENADIPFIIFTGRGREEVVIEAINNGADFYQQKGGDPLSQYAELSQKIRQAVKRRKTEQSLQESEEKFRVLAESSPVGIIVHQDSKFVYANHHMTLITGYGKDELYAQNFWEIVHPDYQEKVKEFGMARLRGEDVPSRYEVKIITKSGESRWGEISPGFFRYKEKSALIVLFVDITDKKKTEDELHAAYEQLAASDEELRAQFEVITESLRRTSESEQNYRSILENLPGAFYRIDMEGNLLMLTPSFAEQFGYSSTEELLGKNVVKYLYVNSSDRDEIISKLKKYGILRKERIVMKRRDGSPVVAAISSRLLFDDSGIPTGIEGIIQDVSYTVKVEDALAESEKLLHLLENNIQDVIWTADMDMNLTYISPSVMMQRGFSQEEALKLSLKDSVTPESFSMIMNSRLEVLELLKMGKPGPDRQIMELEFLRKDGNKIWTEVVITPACDRNGIPVGVIGVSRDISYRKLPGTDKS